MKKLYVLVSNGGDGSNYPNFTFSEELILKLEAADLDGLLSYMAIGCDGDGFHYEVLNLPDECTAESLGISLIEKPQYEAKDFVFSIDDFVAEQGNE